MTFPAVFTRRRHPRGAPVFPAHPQQATRQARQTVFGIGGTELVLILFFGFLVFGPDKLPQMGRTLGRAIRQFRETSEQMNKKFKEDVYDPFQEAVAPVKEAAEKNVAPYKDDIDSIKGIINDTKSMVNEPFKDIKAQGEAMKKSIDPFASDPVPTGDADGAIRDRAGRLPREKAEKAAGADAGADTGADAAADESAKAAAPAEGQPSTAQAAGTQPSASPSESAVPAGEAKPLPKTDADAAPKKTVAASLYGLDDEDGE